MYTLPNQNKYQKSYHDKMTLFVNGLAVRRQTHIKKIDLIMYLCL